MAKKWTKTQMEMAIKGTGGVVGKIAKKLKTDYRTLKSYLEKHPEYKAIVITEQDRIVDVAEDNIIKTIEKGNVGNSKWFLQLVADRYKPSANIGGDMTITLRINGVDKDIFNKD